MSEERPAKRLGQVGDQVVDSLLAVIEGECFRANVLADVLVGGGGGEILGEILGDILGGVTLWRVFLLGVSLSSFNSTSLGSSVEVSVALHFQFWQAQLLSDLVDPFFVCTIESRTSFQRLFSQIQPK